MPKAIRETTAEAISNFKYSKADAEDLSLAAFNPFLAV